MPETIKLIVCSVCFAAGGYIVGWIRMLWQLRQAFPDLYAELKRRCNNA